jgi:hypothetical protein
MGLYSLTIWEVHNIYNLFLKIKITFIHYFYIFGALDIIGLFETVISS